MQKPRIFIGSSTQSKAIAEALQLLLDADADVVVWDQGIFELMQSAVESLEGVLDSFDFGLFVFAGDDRTQIGDREVKSVRDNVVFELGLFMGRLGRDRTVIVQPRDANLHLPTDLLGLTTARFDPDRIDLQPALGASATKIKKVIAKFGRRHRDLPVQVVLAGPPEVDDVVNADSTSDTKPQVHWKQQHYDSAMFRVLGDDKALAQLREAYLSSNLATESGAAAHWDGKLEYMRLLMGKGGSMSRLREIVRDNPSSARLHRLLANALSRKGDHIGAAGEYRAATQVAITAAGVADGVIGIISQEALAEQKSNPTELLAMLQRVPPLPDDEEAVMEALAEISKVSGLADIALAVSERRLEVTPIDYDLRFEVAYQYADKGYNDLALVHYSAIPQQERGEGTWNNLGVTYSALKLPGKAVDAYNQAAEAGNTIASANLSDRLRSAGFFAQAQALLDAATAKPGYADNVVSSLEALRVARADEAEAEQDARTKAREKQTRLRSVGAAAAANSSRSIAGFWDVGPCRVELVDAGNGRATGIGRFEQAAPSGLGNVLQALGGGSPRPRSIRVEVALERVGNAIQGTVSRHTEGEVLSLLGSLLAERRVVGEISADGKTITVLEASSDEQAEIWTKVVSPSTEASLNQ